MHDERKRLGEILADLGVLKPAQIEQVLLAMRRRDDWRKFGQTARDMGLIRDEHILAALAVQMELFPGIQDLPLRRLLGRLQEAPVGLTTRNNQRCSPRSLPDLPRRPS